MRSIGRAWAVLGSMLVLLGPLTALAQQLSRPGRAPGTTPGWDAHAQHGTLKGWRFTWLKGDVARGRRAFAMFDGGYRPAPAVTENVMRPTLWRGRGCGDDRRGVTDVVL
jgi:hypothetical protein